MGLESVVRNMMQANRVVTGDALVHAAEHYQIRLTRVVLTNTDMDILEECFTGPLLPSLTPIDCTNSFHLSMRFVFRDGCLNLEKNGLFSGNSDRCHFLQFMGVGRRFLFAE